MIQQARIKGVKSAAYLDHWVNYRERFGYPFQIWLGKLPDEIWCGDEYAMEICRNSGIPAQKLRLVGNEYFGEIKEEAAAHKNDVIPESILYTCEPVADSI